MNDHPYEFPRDRMVRGGMSPGAPEDGRIDVPARQTGVMDARVQLVDDPKFDSPVRPRTTVLVVYRGHHLVPGPQQREVLLDDDRLESSQLPGRQSQQGHSKEKIGMTSFAIDGKAAISQMERFCQTSI